MEQIDYSKEPENKIEFTRRFDKSYSKYAKIYDLLVKIFPIWKKWICQVIPYIEGRKVLEVSFGTGYLLTKYAAQYQTYGIDLNKDLIEITKKNLEKKNIKANLQQGNVEKLPFKNNFFDSIINTMAFTGYPDGKLAMNELIRVLKPKGKLIIVDFNYPKNRNRIGVFIAKFMGKSGDIIRDMDKLFKSFNLEYTDEEIGAFGSVHLYIAKNK
jgi:ubiquinone/menaquinone biosynthesis C-methylase UbiE